MSDAATRIRNYLDARVTMRGLDPESIHCVNGTEELRVSDLRDVLRQLEEAERCDEATVQLVARAMFVAAGCKPEHWDTAVGQQLDVASVREHWTALSRAALAALRGDSDV